MSEQTEKLIHIIMPDLLNYLEMMETGEIYENRLKKNIPLAQREESSQFIVDKTEKTRTKNKFCIFRKK